MFVFGNRRETVRNLHSYAICHNAMNTRGSVRRCHAQTHYRLQGPAEQTDRALTVSSCSNACARDFVLCLK